MKKYLLPKEGRFYKANLHCHTTYSDAILSPEEVKKAYMERGYSIVAYTDHDILISHQDLKDDNFLPLNGYEIEVTEGYENLEVSFDDSFKSKKSCHICLIALSPDNLKQVCWHREAYLFGHSLEHKDEVVFDETKPDYVRTYSSECISDIMREARENGFFVTYNHPVWSQESFPEYMSYNHMHAMEIYNHSSIVFGYDEYSPQAYDDVLRNGKRIFCIAADDNHNGFPFESRKCDSFGGFTMIKAEKLEYTSVTGALEKGNFYASTGPEIYELYIEGNTVYIKCSPADRIVLSTGRRRADIKYCEIDSFITEASFDIFPEDKYVRFTVVDKNEKRANTNAYFTDEILK